MNSGWARHALVPCVLLTLVAFGWLCRPKADSFYDMKNVAPKQQVLKQDGSTSSPQFIRLNATPFLGENEGKVAGERAAVDVVATPSSVPTPTWPQRSKNKTSDCLTCDNQPLVPRQSAYDFVKQGGVLVTTHSAAEAAAQTRVVVPAVRSSLETHGNSGVSVNDRIDMGFDYDPKAWRDGVLEIANRTTGDVTISFHGSEATTCTIDGQQVVEGQEYQVSGMVQVHGSAPVGIHVRTTGGVDPKPASNG